MLQKDKAKEESKQALLKPKSHKRKQQLGELQMLKKEVEHSKITDIKLDSSIEGMIIKLDALTKSNTFLKKI
jgi:hypothetical protein